MTIDIGKVLLALELLRDDAITRCEACCQCDPTINPDTDCKTGAVIAEAQEQIRLAHES